MLFKAKDANLSVEMTSEAHIPIGAPEIGRLYELLAGIVANVRVAKLEAAKRIDPANSGITS